MILFFLNENQFKNKENFTKQIEKTSLPEGGITEKRYKCIRPGKSNIFKTFQKIKNKLGNNILMGPAKNENLKMEKNSFFHPIRKLFQKILIFMRLKFTRLAIENKHN